MVMPSRISSPLGLTSLPGVGRAAGPLGFFPGVFATPNQVGQALKVKLKMPPPAKNPEHKRAHEHTWPLYNKAAGAPTPLLADVEQGYLGNCALASILAALAHTDMGRKHILSLVREQPALVETDLTGFASTLDQDEEAPPHPDIIKTSRLFTVKLAGQSTDVSDVLYTNNSVRAWRLVYMISPTSCLWACVFEKAYASIHGSYAALDTLNTKKAPSANQIWQDVVGRPASVIELTARTQDARILEVIQAAGKLPAIAASNDAIDEKANTQDILVNHGYSVLRWNNSSKRIELWDPMMQKQHALTIAEFRVAFESVLSWQ